MPVVAVYIQKEISFEGAVRPFGNTYHYLVDDMNTLDDAALAAEIANQEKSITSLSVTFKGWRTWGPTDGSDFANVMRDSGLLSGVGSAAAATGSYREVCGLIVWPLARSETTNRRRWLRKFIRQMNLGTTLTANQLQGTDPLTSTQITSINTAYTDQVLNNGPSAAYDLCTEEGDVPIAAGTVRPYLKTRDIGR